MQITLHKQSGVYSVKSEQILSCTLEEAWSFFSNPRNLEIITPADMSFRITNNPPSTTYAGQIITYRIGIFPRIKTNWVTEITHLHEGKFFVDEQRFGPYAMWHHEHHFSQMSDGHVLMTDLVTYKLPFGKFGDLLAGKFIASKVKSIFQNRYTVLEKLFTNH